MKQKLLSAALLILIMVFTSSHSAGWGFWAHQRINRAAVFALPEQMRSFFYNHIDYITEESVIPDVRKYAVSDKAESNRHYIDLEMLRSSPAQTIPQSFREAQSTYHDTLIQAAGLLPWYIDTMTTKLTNAFREKKKQEILFLAADLAHYTGDAHMPLHTTINHDGQLTSQKGIHSFWESYLPEKFGTDYNLHTGDAIYITDIRKEIWRIIESSHQLVDTLLRTEKNLRSQFPANQVFQTDSAGKIMKNKYNQTVFSLAYAKRFHESLNGMVERQLRLSIMATANLWYTAWVNAGKPDLGSLDPAALTKRNRKYYKSEFNLWKKGQLFGIQTGNEF
ncbi:MAG: zinc dependent phospholipase C family protein [Chitinophagaceae bacterium]